MRGVQCVYIHVTRERARLGEIYISEALKSLQRALGAFSVWMKFRDGDAGVVTGHFIPASRPGASSGRESAGETTLFSRAETSACRRIDAHTHTVSAARGGEQLFSVAKVVAVRKTHFFL